MTLKNKFFFLLLIVLFPSIVHAQWDSNLSQYWNMKNYYNPSFIGEKDVLETSILHRRQWIGIERSPVTSIVSLNMPLDLFGKRHGIGALITNDKLGLFSNTNFMGQYTYKFKFKGDRYLNIGLQGGMFTLDFDAGKIYLPEEGDYDTSDIPSGGNDKIIDAGLGISWITPKYYVGFSVNHLWEPSFEMDEDYRSYMPRTYYLVAGYNINLGSPLLQLQPSAFYRTDGIFHQIDLTARVNYKNLFNGGISWRKDDGFIFVLGVKIRNIEAGYAYDLSTSAIGKVSNGSHEIFLKYSIPLSKSKARGALKSIRIL